MPLAPQGGEKLRGVTHQLTKLPRASESSTHFGRGPAFNDPQGLATGQLDEQFSPNTFGTLWQPLEQIYRRSETTDRISIRRALQSLLAGPPQILDRLGDVIAVAVVMGEFRQMVVERTCVERFDCVTDPLVQQLAALDQ